MKETICHIGQNSGFDSEGLKAALSLYNERLKDIKEKQITYQKISEDLLRKIESVEAQLGKFSDSKTSR